MNPEQDILKKEAQSTPNHQAERLLASSEARALQKKSDKSIFLGENGISQRVFSAVSGHSRGSIQRAMKAHDEHREEGRKGRPRKLSEEEEKELLDRIEARADNLNAPTRSEIAKIVSFLFQIGTFFRSFLFSTGARYCSREWEDDHHL